MGERKQRVRQAIITPPYCDYVMPVLSVDDSMLYIPLIVLYEMLGLCMLYGMWTVCYSTKETKTFLHPRRFDER